MSQTTAPLNLDALVTVVKRCIDIQAETGGLTGVVHIDTVKDIHLHLIRLQTLERLK